MKVPCARCGQSTRAIKPITPRSLLTEKAREKVTDYDGFRFCPNPACELLYFQPNTQVTFEADAVGVPVFQKSTSATRPVCYCFAYSTLEVRTEALDAGDSLIVKSITDKCRKGEDRCEETNPQGSCCLGNVRAVIRQTRADRGLALAGTDESLDSSCCSATCEAKPRTEDK